MLLQTKLHIPKARDDTLFRPRLVELLQANLDKPLILLSAPAGYGKTTLLTQLAVDASLSVGWYQLDTDDNDPAIFFEYLIESIAARCPNFGSTSRSLLHSSQNIAAEWQRFLVVFINEMVETLSDDILVILEDYHLVESPLIHGFIDRLLAQCPSQLHLLLSTRSDPLISLARLRARRHMAEVRAPDLRFTLEEAHTFLNEIASLNLPAESIRALVQETEGWAAALQLALSSLPRNRSDAVQAFINSFHSARRYLFDYLSEEVLAGQTPEVQTFLLGSSILAQMSPDLCNKLLGIANSQEILETLEARNLFTIALDDRREWYHYHHLFRDFLQERLRRQNSDDVRTLHLRVVAFFETAGDINQAIYHCQEAGEVERLADLIEQAASSYLTRGRLQTVQRWLEAVPDKVLSSRPWLALYRGLLLSTWGQPQEARLLLSQARRAFAATNDELGQSRVLNQLCRVALFEGRYGESLELNHEALRRMPWADHEGRTQALREQAELWLYLGSSVRAIYAIEDSLAHAQQLGGRAVLAERTIFQGTAYRLAGRLSEAMRTLKRGLSMLESADALGAHLAHNQLGAGYVDRWELDQAAEHYQRSLALSQKFHDSSWIVYTHTGLGWIYSEREKEAQAQTHFDAALAVLEQTGMGSILAEVAWNYLAEAHLKAGRYTQAEACSRKAIAVRGDEAGGLAWGMGWLPLAKTYLATGRLDKAEQILLDVGQASEEGGNAVPFIDSAFNLGRLYLKTGREDEALSHIKRALSAAAPEGHRWTFLSRGDEAAPALVHALKHKTEPAFVQGLLRELGEAARPALAQLLTHSDAEVCRYAREALPAEYGPAIETAAVTAPAAALRVTCFGDFKVTYGGQAVGGPGWLATKAGDLFAYFITFRHSSLPRERVLEALWPEMRPDRSSSAFHTALYKLRQMLRLGGGQGKFVRTRGGEYYLEQEQFWIDADEFTTLDDHCSRHQHRSLEDCEACVERLRRAVKLYQGDYLENLYYDWVLDEQRRLQELYLNALRVLAQHYANRGEHEPALAYCRQLLDKDPLLEDVHCRMMRYYGQLGDRNAIIRQYQRLEAILADELGIEPMPDTQELYQALMHG